MELPFDIFRQTADGNVTWVEAVETIETGKARILEISAHSTGEYFILDLMSGSKIPVSGRSYFASSPTDQAND